jgi:hypothetical protein
MWVAFALVIAAAMLFRFAIAIVHNDFSVVIIICGATLFLGSLVAFAIYFKE